MPAANKHAACNAGTVGKERVSWLSNMKNKVNINSAKPRTAAACGALAVNHFNEIFNHYIVSYTCFSQSKRTGYC